MEAEVSIRAEDEMLLAFGLSVQFFCTPSFVAGSLI
jgi:hypothetical protein